MVRGSLSGHQKVLGKCKRSKQQCFQWVLLVCSWGVWLHKDYRNLSVPAALRKSCRVLQNKAFFTTCHGLSVKCLPLAPVSTVSHRLLALNTWSQQATLSGKNCWFFRRGILLKEVVTEGGPWSVMVEPHFLFKCKLGFLFMDAEGPRSLLQLLPCLPCLWLCFLHHDRLYPIRALSSNQSFLSYVAFVRVFNHSNRKIKTLLHVKKK